MEGIIREKKKRDCLTGKATRDPWRSLERGILPQSPLQNSYLKLGKSFKEYSTCCSIFLIRDKPRQVQRSRILTAAKTSQWSCHQKLHHHKSAQGSQQRLHRQLLFPNFQMFGFATWGFACSKKATPQGKIAANSVTLLCQNPSRAELHVQKNQLEVLVNT